MNKALKLILSIPLIVLCCWIIFHATKIALADISHYPLKYFIEKLKPTELPDLKILEKLQEKIQYSIDLRPNSAEYLEYIGRIYYLKALRQQRAASFEIRSKAQNSFRLALNAHIKATKLRPKWPYSWANLALIKSHLKEFDQQFLNAIDLAIKNGPWEIASNNAISQAGFKVITYNISIAAYIAKYFHHVLNILVYIIFEKARNIKYNFWNSKLMLL